MLYPARMLIIRRSRMIEECKRRGDAEREARYPPLTADTGLAAGGGGHAVVTPHPFQPCQTYGGVAGNSGGSHR
jgi:hypothetical protein